MYIGYPETDDDLYRRWEASRLQLKKVYLAKPDEDLYIQKPTKEQEKQLAKMKKETGNFDLVELNVSLLWVFWRVYDCWGLVYYDWGRQKAKIAANKKNKKEAKVEYIRKMRQKERSADIAYLEKTFSIADGSVLQIHATRTEEAVQMLFNLYKDHPRFGWLGETKTEEEKLETQQRIIHYLSVMLRFYFQNQEVWAYQDIDARLLAVALVEPLHHKSVSLTGLASNSLKDKKLKKERLKALEDHRKTEREYKKEVREAEGKKDKEIRVIHYVGVADDTESDAALSKLVKAIALKDAYDTFAVEYLNAPQWVNTIWEEAGFKREKQFNYYSAKFMATWYRALDNVE